MACDDSPAPPTPPATGSVYRAVGASAFFDADWYATRYPDVAQTGLSALRHYVDFGAMLGRWPSRDFDPVAYALTHPGLGSGHPVLHAEQTYGAARRAIVHDPNLVLQAAAALAARYGPAYARTFARDHLPGRLARSAAILDVLDAARGRDAAGWLAGMNAYLGRFDLAPIALVQREGALFDRIGAAAVPAVLEGPLVSVLMPVWNAAAWVGQAARSILGQSWRNLELIAVDDASTDGSWDVLQRIAATDRRMTLLRNAVNAGPYVSKNRAARAASGALVTGQDADDWSHPQRIERQVAAMGADPAVLSGVVRLAGDGLLTRFPSLGVNSHDGVTAAGFITLMLRAEWLHEMLGAWDCARFGADSELIRRTEAVRGRPVPRRLDPVVLMRDHAASLTNDAAFGHSPATGMMPPRRAYRDAMVAWHATLTQRTARLPFPPATGPNSENSIGASNPASDPDSDPANDPGRPFPAPPEAAVATDTIRAAMAGPGPVPRRRQATVVIVTNLRFPGGNASTTLDEMRFFADRGIDAVLIHSPSVFDRGRRPLGMRFDAVADRIVPAWSVDDVHVRHLIWRSPANFEQSEGSGLIEKLRADTAHLVVNNGAYRGNGDPVYDRTALFARAARLRADRILIHPISPEMRRELTDVPPADRHGLEIAAEDWTPTFDVAAYRDAPRARMTAPFVLGRHGRDAADKWLEVPGDLRAAYPADPDFAIEILGGAAIAAKTLGGRPTNWTVHPFGAMDVRAYLARLDIFVYYCHRAYVEGFGRTIVEAMIAGVPVLLPRQFALTFGDLPLYAPPRGVAAAVRAMAADDPGRLAYLAEVQRIAMARFATPGLARRFPDLCPDAAPLPADATRLSAPAAAFRRRIEAAADSA